MGKRVLLVWLLGAGLARAELPVASYMFPAGGQRGTTVNVRVGGLFLNKSCGFEMLGRGVTAPAWLTRARTTWFEGPLLPLPESQQAEDYPKDMAGRVQIAAQAQAGVRYWRLWTSQGATPAMKFMVGELPEIIEQEIDGDPVPVSVKLPVTINGRIFPRENVDLWSFEAQKDQTISCEVHAARLGSPLDSRLEILDPQGRKIAENDDAIGADSFVRFTAPVNGIYQVKIHDVNFNGGPAYVYRLTLSADPWVDRAYPLGGRRGSSVKFELSGQGLPAGPVEIQLPGAGPRDYAHRLTVAGKSSNALLLELDDLPEYLEAEPNDEPSQVKPLTVPAVLNGRIGKPGDVDYWAVTLRKGEIYEFDLRAGRLGSPLEAVLVLLDATGKELARVDGPASGLVDPSLRFTAPADGTYYAWIEERFRSRGGPAFAYRLRVDRPAGPGFQLRLGMDALTLPRGGQAKLKITTERLGDFPDAIQIALEGLPQGVTASTAIVPATQGGVEISLTAAATAPIRAGRLTVRGTATIGGKAVTKTATLPPVRGLPEVDSVLLAVALPTPFKIKGQHDFRWAPRGTVHQRHYQLERGGFTGPIEVSMADRQMRHLQGVTGPTILVPSDVSAFDYAITLPPWMETGRTARAVVTATGVIKDVDGSEHEVSFSSVQPDDQVIVVVEPGRLSVEAERQSITVASGKTVLLPVRVTRGKSLVGPVKLELIVASHIRGIHAESVTVPADQDNAAVPIHFDTDAGPWNCPVVIRATVTDKNRPVTGETEKIEIRTEN